MIGKTEIWPDLTPAEIRDNLDAECTAKESSLVVRSLTDQEISNYESKHVQNSITIKAKELEFKREAKAWREEIKALKEADDYVLEVIKHRQIEETADLYWLPNFNDGRMYCYTGHGILVRSRPMNPDERQFNIDHSFKKTS